MNERSTISDDDYEITNSPLECKIEKDGIYVEICIYRGEDDPGWILEVRDHKGGSTVWDDRFATDKEALDEAMREIEKEGITSFAEATTGGATDYQLIGRANAFLKRALEEQGFEVRGDTEESDVPVEIFQEGKRFAVLAVVTIQDTSGLRDGADENDDIMLSLIRVGLIGLQANKGEARIVEQILSAAPNLLKQESPRILAFLNGDLALTTMDLKDVLTGPLSTLDDDTRRQVRRIREEIDLYLWLDLEDGRCKAVPMTMTGRRMKRSHFDG